MDTKIGALASKTGEHTKFNVRGEIWFIFVTWGGDEERDITSRVSSDEFEEGVDSRE